MRNRIRRWCPGHFVCLLVIRQLGLSFDPENSSQCQLLLWRREAMRRMLFVRARTQASEPPLTDSSLAAQDRAKVLHVVCFQPSIRAQHDV